MSWLFGKSRKRKNSELNEELCAHLTLAERDARESAGSSADPQDAANAARREFGNESLAAELTRDQWAARWLFEFFQDARFALRMLRKNPGFTAVAVLTLALGIGANVAIFTVVDAVLLRPLPYRDAGRIVFFFEMPPRALTFSNVEFSTTLVDYGRRYPDFFSRIASEVPGTAILSGVSQAEAAESARVSSDFFDVLGWSPAIGRTFTMDDEKPGAPPVVILSDDLWSRALNRDPSAIGRPVMLDNVAHRVIGIMPSGFQNPIYPGAKLWVPAALGGERTQWIARLAGTATLREVQSRLTAAEQSLGGKGPDWQVNVSTLPEATLGDLRAQLLILLACTEFVLLLACTNVTNLLLARGAARRLELAIRSAIGANRARIVRQMLAEGAVLGVAGGIAGIFVSYWTVKVLQAIAPPGIPRLETAHVDLRVAAFAFAVAVLSALLYSAWPALRLARGALGASLKEGIGIGSSSGVRHSRSLGVLIAVEVALALILSVGASLFVRSFLRLRPVHPGFEPANKVTFMLRPIAWKYSTLLARQEFFDQLAQRLASLPRVQQVGAADFLPFSGMMSVSRAYLTPGDKGIPTNSRAITPNYFQLMQIPLLTGRAFAQTDDANARNVAIVSRATAEQFWPGQNALGKHFTAGYRTGDLEVVGIVGETRESGVSLRRWPQFYVPFQQTKMLSATFIISVSGDPANLASAIRAAVLSVDKDQPITAYKTLAEMASANFSFQRFNVYLVGSFAAIAMLLAAVGIYGVISYSVRQRSRELGIRIALGASSRHIVQSAVGATLLLAVLGLLAGWLASFWLARLISSQLHAISPNDPAANFVAASAMCLVAAAASYIPARRATRVDPIAALRHE